MRFNPKSKNRRRWLLVGAVCVAAFLVAGQTMNTSPPTNSAQTAPDAMPELRTRAYVQPVEEVAPVARQVALEQKTWLRSWRVVKMGNDVIRVEVPVLFFTDDLTVHIDTDDAGKTRVNVESKSRVGQGDFGENRRHVAQFFKSVGSSVNQARNVTAAPRPRCNGHRQNRVPKP